MKKNQGKILLGLILFAIISTFSPQAIYAKAEQSTSVLETQSLSSEVKTDYASSAKENNQDNNFGVNQNKVTPASQTSFGWSKYFQAIGIMLFLLLVLWYVLKLVRQFGNGRFLPSQKLLPKDAMYLEAQLPFGPNRSIALIKVLDKRLVVGITENNITLIKEVVPANEENYARIFEEHLEKPE